LAIKWTKDDVIKKFQEAMIPQEAKPSQKPALIQKLKQEATQRKGEPIEGEVV